jgi:hypothetical protein
MQSMYYVGLDVHKKTISYCVKDGSGRIHLEGTIPATRIDLDRWMKTLPQPWMAAMEATVFTGWIYDHLKPHAAALKVDTCFRKLIENSNLTVRELYNSGSHSSLSPRQLSMSTRIVGHCREMNPAMVSRAQVTGVALAGELLKNAKKMVSAEFRLPCEGAKRLVEIRAAFKVKGYVEHYNVRLNSAIGYITPKDMLAEYKQEIQAERDRKLEAAREQRKNRRQGSRDGRNGLLPVGRTINYPPKPPQNGALIEDLLGGIIYTALFGETPSTS